MDGLLTIRERIAPSRSARVRALDWSLVQLHSAEKGMLGLLDVRDRLLATGRVVLRRIRT